MRTVSSRKTFAAFFLAAATTQPVVAADHTVAGTDRGNRIGVFAGATLKLPLNGRQVAKPVARLNVSALSSRGSASAAPLRGNSGLEIGASRAGKPALLLGGQDLAHVKRQLNMAGDATPWVIGGVAVVLVAALLLSAGDDDDESELPGIICPPGTACPQ